MAGLLRALVHSPNRWDIAMTTKHTPGPWAVDGTNVGIPLRCFNGEALQEFSTLGDSEVCTDEDEANALLIAAAPDLLESLQSVLAFFREFDGPDVFDEIECEALTKARAAIAKATGESS